MEPDVELEELEPEVFFFAWSGLPPSEELEEPECVSIKDVELPDVEDDLVLPDVGAFFSVPVEEDVVPDDSPVVSVCTRAPSARPRRAKTKNLMLRPIMYTLTNLRIKFEWIYVANQCT